MGNSRLYVNTLHTYCNYPLGWFWQGTVKPLSTIWSLLTSSLLAVLRGLQCSLFTHLKWKMGNESYTQATSRNMKDISACHLLFAACLLFLWLRSLSLCKNRMQTKPHGKNKNGPSLEHPKWPSRGISLIPWPKLLVNVGDSNVRLLDFSRMNCLSLWPSVVSKPGVLKQDAKINGW